MTKGLLVAAAAVLLIAAAPVMAPGTEADRAPGWLVKPDGERIARFYPDRAMREGVEGRVVIACTVETDTRLHDCRIEAETPAGYGFGAAALKLSDEMRLAPAIRNGVPVEAAVKVPLAFNVPPPVSLVEMLPSRKVLFSASAAALLFGGFLLAMLVVLYRQTARRSDL